MGPESDATVDVGAGVGSSLGATGPAPVDGEAALVALGELDASCCCRRGFCLPPVID